ncbi:MAG: SIS domain-containing protein [bacterium]|nr:SIS domain-containing protein [bacterium]
MEEKVTSFEEMKEMIAEIVEKMKKKGGIKNVYCLACGGSHACLYPMEYFLRTEAKNIAVHSITSNEFVYAMPKAVDENTLVFAMSLMGGTKETVEAAKAAKAAGATVVALCAKHEVPLVEPADYTVIYRIDIGYPVEEQNQMKILTLAVELLNQTEGYVNYDAMLDGYDKIGEICTKAIRQVKDRAIEFGRDYKDEPVLYTMASGASSKVAYMQSICMFMEMEWVHSSSIHCGEFFHGPFEVTDYETPFMIFMGEGRTRYLDERALKFLRTYAKKVIVIDAKELGLDTISDEVIEYFNPILHWAVGLEYAEGLAQAKKHPIFMRRYMYKVEY